MRCPNCKIETVRISDPERGYKCPICPFITFDNSKIINELAAIVSVNQEGNEGLIAMDVNGVKMAAVNTSYKFLKENVYDCAKKSMPEGYSVKLKKFKLVSEE